MTKVEFLKQAESIADQIDVLSPPNRVSIEALRQFDPTLADMLLANDDRSLVIRDYIRAKLEK